VPYNIQLLCIDPQNSFCKVVPQDRQQVDHNGELCVGGAWDDMTRVANLVNRLGDKLSDITITLDSHSLLHIAHPIWFKDGKGNAPGPFTCMREENGAIVGSVFGASGWVDIGEFQTVMPSFYKRTLEYLKALKTGNRYPHCIWPPHCLIGTPGHNIMEPLLNALLLWEKKYVGLVNKVTKGSNIYVEHFSAVKAEVTDPNDPTTQLNTDLINMLMEADEVLLAGEARSHCLANTVRDIANSFADDSFIKKCTLLTDCTSDVAGFEKYGVDFVTEMTGRGMKTAASVDYLK
jgi:nicotinamidase/pyrazinamidase